MRILHIENQAGVAFQLAQAQKRMGHEALVAETWANAIQEPHDREFYYTHASLGKDLFNGLELIKFAQGFDIIHVHGGLHWKRWDALALKLGLRKPLVVHYHGSEARDGYGMHYGSIADHKYISRPDLFRWVPDGEYVPNPVGEHPYSFDMEKRPRVIHMATNRRAKGTDLIEKALQELTEEGLDFDHIVLQNVDHQRAMEELAGSHILIDQVIDVSKVGIPSIIGLASFEAMAMGKVAISTFDEEYRKYYPGCPVITIDPDAKALKSAVREAVRNLESVKELGLAGREYVRREHSADVIVQRIMPVYRSLLSK